jgi:hypothetical protein
MDLGDPVTSSAVIPLSHLLASTSVVNASYFAEARFAPKASDGVHEEGEIRGLAPGDVYLFELHARNMYGTSRASDLSQVVQMVPTLPSVMDPPTLAAVSPFSLDLAWLGPSDNGAGISEYLVQRKSVYPIAETEFGYDLVVKRARSATIGGLTPAFKYVFRAASTNAWGRSAFSAASSAMVTLSSSPTAVLTLSVVDNLSFLDVVGNKGRGNTTLRWREPNPNGESIETYSLEFLDVTSNVIVLNLTVAARDTTQEPNSHNPLGQALHMHTLTLLEPGETYRFRVAASNRLGQGPFSEFSQAFFVPPTLPSAPAAPAVVFRGAAFDESRNRGYANARVAWAGGGGGGASSGNNGAGITAYYVEYTLAADVAFEDVVGSTWTDRNEAWLEELVPSETYRVRVASRNAVGLGPLSPSSNGIQMLATKPSAPRSARASGAASTLNETSNLAWASVSLAWDAPEANGAAIYQYEVYVRALETSTLRPGVDLEHGVRFVNSTATATTMNATVGSLRSGVKYEFEVAARNAEGLGPRTSLKFDPTVVRMPPIFPSAPLAPLVSNATLTSVTLVWTDPDRNGADITKYRFQLTDFGARSGIAVYRDVPATLRQGRLVAVVEDLDEATLYRFKVIFLALALSLSIR